MGIGASIFLLALGAILAFAVDFHVSGLDINVIGYILMLAGVLGLVLTLAVWGPRRRRAAVVQERRYVDDPTQPPPPGY
jgi:hypothetical protein